MRAWLIIPLIMACSLSALAGRVEIEINIKKRWPSQKAVFAGYFKRGSQVGLAVALQNKGAVPGDPWDGPGYAPPTPDTELISIEGLKFNKSLGDRGAWVFQTGDFDTVCSYKTFWGDKETGDCQVEVTDFPKYFSLRFEIQ